MVGMDKVNGLLDIILVAAGTITGIANIEQVLGVVILGVQAAWLLVKLIVKIIQQIKSNKPLESLDDDVKRFTDLLGAHDPEPEEEEDDEDDDPESW